MDSKINFNLPYSELNDDENNDLEPDSNDDPERNVSIEDEAHKEGEESGSRNWEPKPQPEYVSLRVFYVIVGILTSATMFVVLMSALIVLAARGDPNGEPPSSTLSPDQMSIWVVGGSGPHEGNLMVRRNSDGFVGPVCDDTFTESDGGITQATVACRQMGYPAGAVRFTRESFFGHVENNFALDDVRCSGTETRLDECRHTTLHNCGSSEGAGVVCITT